MGKILLIPAGWANRASLGLLYLARAALNGGYKKEDIIYFYRELDESIEKVSKQHDYDIIGLSTTEQSMEDDAKVALIAKKNNPNALLVVGGHFASHRIKRAELMTGADVVVRGEGELFFRDFCRKVRENKIKAPLTEDDVRFLAFKHDFSERHKGERLDRLYKSLALSPKAKELIANLQRQPEKKEDPEAKRLRGELIALLLAAQEKPEDVAAHSKKAEELVAKLEKYKGVGPESVETKRLRHELLKLQRTNLRRYIDLAGGVFFYDRKALDTGPPRYLSARELNSPEWAPYFDIVDYAKFVHEGQFVYKGQTVHEGQLVIKIMTSRGCPMRCTICALNHTQFRKIKPTAVVGWIDSLVKKYHKQGIKFFFFDFVDDTFTMDRSHVLRLCNEVIKAKKRSNWPYVEFHCQTRVDKIDKTLLVKMHAAGFRTLHCGVEAFSENVLAELRKGYTIETINKAVNMVAEAGLDFTCYMILFTPKSTVYDVINTVSFIVNVQRSGRKARANLGVIPLSGSEVGGAVEPTTTCVCATITNPRKRSARWNETFGSFLIPTMIVSENKATAFALHVTMAMVAHFIKNEKENPKKLYDDGHFQYRTLATFLVLKHLTDLFAVDDSVRAHFPMVEKDYLEYLKEKFPKYYADYSTWDRAAKSIILQGMIDHREYAPALFEAFKV